MHKEKAFMMLNEDINASADKNGGENENAVLQSDEFDSRKKAHEIELGQTFSSSGDALVYDLDKINKERQRNIGAFKKRFRTFTVLASVVLVLILSYAFIISPLTKSDDTEPVEIELIPATKEEKALGKCESISGDRILIFDQISTDNIQSISVHNSHGDYTFYRDEAGFFDLKGAEGITYSQNTLTSLLTYAAYPLSMTRIGTNIKDFRQYGLDEGNNPIYYELTTTLGVTHKMYIGNKLTTGAGYYVRYEDRPAVYVLSAALGQVMALSVNEIIVPTLATPTDSSNFYNVSTFKIANSLGVYLQIDCPILLGEKVGTDSNAGGGNEETYFEMRVPTKYAVNTQTYIEILQKFVNVAGNEVLEFRLNDDLIAEYGFNIPWRTLYYKFGDDENIIYFSKSPDPNIYYACSTKFDIIASVNAADFDFLNWDVTEFVDKPLVVHYITNVSKVEISGKNVSASFDLITNFDKDGTPSLISVTEGSQKREIDIPNFRSFYRYILTMELEGVASAETPDGLECIATMRITQNDGTTEEYKFYPYSNRRCLYTLNGEGNFYILRDSVNKLLADTFSAMNNQTVDYSQRY